MSFSTLTFQTNAVDQIENIDAQISKAQNELSSGTKLPNAAADPVGMARVNELNAQLSASQQYDSNGNLASSNLKLEEQALTNATNVLQSAQSLATQANDGTLNTSDLQVIATQVDAQLNQVTTLSNTTNANGRYLFAGQAGGTQPFAQSAGTVTYSGSDRVNQIEIGPNQFISAGDTGSAVFMNVPAGNGTFTTSVGPANTGSASIDPGTVTNPTAWVPDTYTISFTSPTQYTVTNSAGTTVTSGTYTSGDSIAFNGIQVKLSGTPATGDQFTIAPAGKTSVFSILSGLSSTLKSTSLTSAQRTTQIEGALQQLGNAVTQLSDVQASVGARINAVSTSQSSAQSTRTALQASISKLSDTDYAAATTKLSSEEIALQAAEKSYASIAKLSLFQYL